MYGFVNLVSLGKDFNHHYFGDSGKLCVFEELVPHTLNGIINAVIKKKMNMNNLLSEYTFIKGFKK